MLLNQLLCLLFALSMKSINLETIKVGDILPELITEPITSSTLSEYAKASGDYNPIHLDSKLAKKVGLPNVIAHGMLIMSYLARSITNHIDQVLVKEYGVKFSSMTNLDDKQCLYQIIYPDYYEEYKNKYSREIEHPVARISKNGLRNSVSQILLSDKCLEKSIDQIKKTPDHYIKGRIVAFIVSHSKFAFEYIYLSPINFCTRLSHFSNICLFT